MKDKFSCLSEVSTNGKPGEVADVFSFVKVVHLKGDKQTVGLGFG